MKSVRPVRVRWLDSVGHGGWHACASVSAEPPQPSRIESVGYLLERSRTAITIAGSLSEDTQETMHLLTIPRAAVVSIESL